MSIFLEFMVSILWEKSGNKPKLETAIARWNCFFFSHKCHTLLDLPHKMSQIDDCDCAMFVSQHCSANIKASAQGSSWKFKKGLSRNQVAAPAINVGEAWDKTFKRSTGVILIESYHWNEDFLNWCLSENIK